MGVGIVGNGPLHNAPLIKLTHLFSPVSADLFSDLFSRIVNLAGPASGLADGPAAFIKLNSNLAGLTPT